MVLLDVALLFVVFARSGDEQKKGCVLISNGDNNGHLAHQSELGPRHLQLV